jgi:phosphoglycerate dehydrogenase-like enzyme
MAVRVMIFTGGDDRTLIDAIASVAGVDAILPRERTEACAGMAEAQVLVSSDHAWGPDLAAAIENSSRLNWVQLTTAGYDRLARHGIRNSITVSTIGDVGADLVAEHALTLLLSLCRRAPALVRAQQRGEWAFAAEARAIRSLRDRHVAVLGFGHIGQAVAKLARAFGAEVTGIARSARRDSGGYEVIAITALDRLLPQSDALVNCLPLTPGTEGLIDAAMLAALKPGAFVVNISRGRIVVTDALVAALEAGHLGGAGLDVTDPEPLPPEHPLWRLPNVIITPHVAWAGGGTTQRRLIAERVTTNLRRYIGGETVPDIATIE